MPTFHGQILNNQIILNVGVQDDAGKKGQLLMFGVSPAKRGLSNYS